MEDVIDVSKQAAANHDYQAQLSDIKTWEKDNGPIPAGSFVILRTDWSKRWPDPQAYFNKDKDGQKHYPGWGMEALTYLIQEKKIAAKRFSGHCRSSQGRKSHWVSDPCICH